MRWANWFNLFVEKIRIIISDIFANASNLKSSADNPLNVSHEMAQGAAQMWDKAGGVAVAANEIKDLAHQTAQATQGIKEQINVINA